MESKQLEGLDLPALTRSHSFIIINASARISHVINQEHKISWTLKCKSIFILHFVQEPSSLVNKQLPKEIAGPKVNNHQCLDHNTRRPHHYSFWERTMSRLGYSNGQLCRSSYRHCSDSQENHSNHMCH